VYKGKAVVSSLVTTGAVTVCQARLSEDLLKLDMSALGEPDAVISPAFKSFFKKWQSFYKISPEYKLVVADIQSFLHDLRLWLDQLEMRVAGSPEEQTKLERAVLHELATSPVLYGLFERFENIAESIPEEHRAAHRAFGQRQLHSLLLCSPFLYRTYSKPLGFAGDYEMMNMIVRNQSEGQSLYAKVINSYLLSQVAPQAVRNRVGFLQDRILSETSRVARAGGVANIFCIACGPAWEARNFVAESPLADRARFRLLDFNEETLEHARVKMEEASRHNHRKTTVEVVKNSVQNLLKAGRRTNSPSGGYDLIYCSGLYDYLNEHVIKALNSYLYNLLQPGGLLVVGNFAVGTPVRNFMEHFAEWFLIYRSSQELAALGPTQVPLQECRVVSELTGANLFLEVRKSQ
jgi:extracellular factor (EF) 3-hydroxypalmitic acid methyl ester biosynthesis protein